MKIGLKAGDYSQIVCFDLKLYSEEERNFIAYILKKAVAIEEDNVDSVITIKTKQEKE